MDTFASLSIRSVDWLIHSLVRDVCCGSDMFALDHLWDWLIFRHRRRTVEWMALRHSLIGIFLNKQSRVEKVEISPYWSKRESAINWSKKVVSFFFFDWPRKRSSAVTTRSSQSFWKRHSFLELETGIVDSDEHHFRSFPTIEKLIPLFFFSIERSISILLSRLSSTLICLSFFLCSSTKHSSQCPMDTERCHHRWRPRRGQCIQPTLPTYGSLCGWWSNCLHRWPF